MALLALHLFGPPRLERQGILVNLQRRKALALLAYLALSRRAQHRGSLAALLWPDEGDSAARANLRSSLAALRQGLGDGWLVAEGETVRLRSGADLWLDVDCFRSSLAACREHDHGADAICADCLGPLAEAVALFHGDFLAGFTLADSPDFDDWQSMEAERLRGELAWALQRLVRGYGSLGNAEQALVYAKRWLVLDALHEPAQRAVMLAHAWAGDQTAALRQYRACASILDQELGVLPSQETEQLAEAIRARQVPPPPPLASGRESAATGVAVVAEASPAASSLTYRRVFVGREVELGQLRAAFEEAMSGRGGLVLLAGEPGIGKTALCEQLTGYIESRGGRTLAGHCHESAALSLPYSPFVEALTSHVLRRDPVELRRELGSGAAQITRIVPEVRHKLAVVPPHPTGGEDERYLLLRAITDFLFSIASSQPLLLTLEDLHDADQGTIDVLTHTAQGLSGQRLLIVGTYRDVELTDGHPLSKALAELHRLPALTRLALRGLGVGDVGRMMLAIAGTEAPTSLAEAVHRHTEGNPLFVREVVRYLAEDSLASAFSGLPASMPVPEGLRAAIGRRLRRLGPACHRLLPIAAVIGRDFSPALLQRVSQASDEELFTALEESTAAAVIEEVASPVGVAAYRFSHALFRQMLYDGMSAPRRARLHQRVGRALERLHARERQRRAAELAEHFSRCGDSADLTRAVSYGEMAAAQATAVFAHGEAARLLQQALRVQEALDPDDSAKRCDLLLALGEAMSDAGQPRHVSQHEAPQALALAETMGDHARAARACQVAIMAAYLHEGPSAYATAEYSRWLDRLNLHAGPGALECVADDLARGSTPPGAAITQLRSALDSACQRGDADSWWQAAFHVLASIRAPGQTEATLCLAEEVAEAMRGDGPFAVRQDKLLERHRVGEQAAEVLLVHGRRARAEQLWAALKIAADESGQVHAHLWSLEADVIRVLMDGRIDEAVAISRCLLADADSAGLSGYVGCVAAPGVRARWHLGLDPSDARDPGGPPDIWHSTSPYWGAVREAHAGRLPEARQMLDRIIGGEPGLWAFCRGRCVEEVLVGDLEAAVLTGHRRAVEAFLPWLSECGGHTTADYLPACTGRHLGAAAHMLGRPEEALGYYEEALDVATRMRFRPEIALIRLQLAELFLEHYPERRGEAIAHLDFAIGELREMKMAPSLERALGHKGLLKA